MILGATLEQEQAVRKLGEKTWKQVVFPPKKELGLDYVKVVNYGQWGAGVYFVLADGTVQRWQPQ